MIFYLSAKSLKNRWFTTLLCVFSIALSVALYLGIERVRIGARDGFTNTISQADLIVGAKGGQLNLLLYSIFHLGSAVNNIRMSSYEEIKSSPSVAWAIPISLGDAYKGFRVVATDENFFLHYRFRENQSIKFQYGQMPTDVFDVVIGSNVAKKLQHQLDDPIILSHGISSESILSHDKTPFKIVGILAPTQTPIDSAVYINLYGMEAMHVGWETGVPSNEIISQEKFQKENLRPTQITSFIIGLKSRIHILKMRRFVDEFSNEALMGIIPALSLQEMWETIGYIENVLKLVSSCVLLVGIIGVLISLYTSLNERRREMAILRSIGASALSIFSLLIIESFLLVSCGILMGISFLYIGLISLRPMIEEKFNLYLPVQNLSTEEWKIVLMMLSFSILAGLIPAIKAYKNSLQDGLSIRS